MKKEFKRKFLVTQDQIKHLFGKKLPYACFQVLQGYFWDDDRYKEYKIKLFSRKEYFSAVNALLTIQEIPRNVFDHHGDDRERFETSIDPKNACYHLKNTCTKFLEKIQYLYEWKHDVIFEINIFNERLSILEIEFSSMEEMDSYEPDFDFSRDVTNERNFYDYYLAESKSKDEVKEMIKYFEEKMM